VSGSGRAEVEAHLAECDDCRAELTSWQGVRAAVRQAGDGPVVPGPAVLAGALKRIDTLASRSRGPAGGARRFAVIRGGRTARLLAAAASVAVAVTVVLNAGWFAGRGPTAQAREALHGAARVAAARADTALRPGQYWYSRSERLNTADFDIAPADGATPQPAALQPTRLWVTEVSELWLAADGSGRVRTRVRPAIRGPQDRQAWKQSPPELRRLLNLDERFPATKDVFLGLTYQQLRALPTQEQALTRRLRSLPGNGRSLDPDAPANVALFSAIGDLLRDMPTPPAVRAALYRVAADLPGVTWAGRVRDPAGRVGDAVALNDGSFRYELIFDPATAILLAERVVVTRTDEENQAPVGTVVGAATYKASGVVNTITATIPDRGRG